MRRRMTAEAARFDMTTRPAQLIFRPRAANFEIAAQYLKPYAENGNLQLVRGAAWRSDRNDDQLRFVLTQGKKRQIRRMCEAVGLQVLGLKRVRIGQVMLGDLPAGQWRYLRMDEAFV